MSDVQRVNGNDVSWGSFALKIDGVRYYGVRSVNYSHRRERTLGWNMDRSGAPARRSRGKYTPDTVKVGFYKDTVQEIRKALAAQSESGIEYGDVECDGLLQYTEGEKSGTVEFDRMVFVAVTGTVEEGPDFVVEEVEFSVMAIREDGLILYSQPG